MPEMTDDAGEFAIAGLPPDNEVSVEVWLGDRMTDGPVKAIAGTTQPVAVTILPGLATASWQAAWSDRAGRQSPMRE